MDDLHQFDACLVEDGDDPHSTVRWTVDVPASVVASLNGLRRVAGTINGAPFERRLRLDVVEQPYATGPPRWRIWFGRWWVEAAGLRVGDAVSVVLWPTAGTATFAGPAPVADRAAWVRQRVAAWQGSRRASTISPESGRPGG